jgi:RNA polymerase sigma-70 factor (ECF subfamily)
MSAPLHERALPLPKVWGRKRVRAISPPAIPKVLSPSDEEAMARLSANDANGLDILFERYSRLVFGIAVRILQDYGEAEEVVQEVFFSVFQKAKLFNSSKGTPKAWITEIAFHRALDRKSYLDRRGFRRGTEVGCLDDTLMGETDLDEEIGARLNRALLQQAFQELPEVQRRTLELFYFEGLELREVAETLNETWENVRHHFYRGLERLRKNSFVERLRGI